MKKKHQIYHCSRTTMTFLQVNEQSEYHCLPSGNRSCRNSRLCLETPAAVLVSSCSDLFWDINTTEKPKNITNQFSFIISLHVKI